MCSQNGNHSYVALTVVLVMVEPSSPQRHSQSRKSRLPNSEDEQLMERAILKGSLIFSTGHSQSEVTPQEGCQGNNYSNYLDVTFPISSAIPTGPLIGWTHHKTEGKEPKASIREKGGEYICRGKLTLSGTQCLTEGLSKQVETSSKINAKNNH